MNNETTKSVEEYIEFVNEMISKYKKIGDLVDSNSQITPSALNTALALYFNTSMALIGEYQREKISYEAEKLEFQLWDDEKFKEAKNEVLSQYKDTKIKPALKEFETHKRLANKNEWLIKNLSLSKAESRMRFLLRMLETLKSYDRILTTIANNMRTELSSLSIEDRVNATPQGVSKNRVRIPSRVKVTK